MRPLGLWLVLVAASSVVAQEERSLAVGASVTESLGVASTVAFFKVEIPPGLGAVHAQLSGCGTGSDGEQAPTGSSAPEVKAFLSFVKPKPSVWDAQRSLSWCAQEPTLLELARGTPASSNGSASANGTASANATTVLHVSVFATGPARFTFAVTRSVQELNFGELGTFVVRCANSATVAPRPIVYYTSATRFTTPHYGTEYPQSVRRCASLAITVPSDAPAITVRAWASHLPSPSSPRDEYGNSYRRQYGTPRAAPLLAALSMTVANLTLLPASWSMTLNGTVAEQGAQAVTEGGVLRIARSSPAFCKTEPCKLTIQLFAPELSGMEPNASFSVSIGVFGEDGDVPEPYGLLDVRVGASLRTVGGASTCAPGCKHGFVADGVCDEACLTPACRDDGADCTYFVRPPSGGHGAVYPFCAPGCRFNFLGDGVCDDACFVKSCGWDQDDCSRAIRAQRFASPDAGN
ncbi:hypothetical protein KFE25_000426 [Diacronema lutheri]|uniref:LNR domain-containing protein n=2 Tax=Diacronema lutheri TaxID=2081491 RepID=A0A8J5XX94_DIALT|nr:hypothetical protein KFE25_000426 [Diacronema lutheri]